MENLGGVIEHVRVQDARRGVTMYLPKHFEETRVEVLHELIHTHPLGALVTLMPGGLDANHVPFEVDPARRRSGPCAATWPAPIRSGVTPRATWRPW
jgi:hypothetical protein